MILSMVVKYHLVAHKQPNPNTDKCTAQCQKDLLFSGSFARHDRLRHYDGNVSQNNVRGPPRETDAHERQDDASSDLTAQTGVERRHLIGMQHLCTGRGRFVRGPLSQFVK